MVEQLTSLPGNRNFQVSAKRQRGGGEGARGSGHVISSGMPVRKVSTHFPRLWRWDFRVGEWKRTVPESSKALLS